MQRVDSRGVIDQIMKYLGCPILADTRPKKKSSPCHLRQTAISCSAHDLTMRLPRIMTCSELADKSVDPALGHLLDLLEGESLAVVRDAHGIGLGVASPRAPVVRVPLLGEHVADAQPSLAVEVHVAGVVEQPAELGDLLAEDPLELGEPPDARGSVLVAEDAEVDVGLGQGHHGLPGAAAPEVLGALHPQLPVVVVLALHGRDHLAAVADVSGAAVHQGHVGAARVAVGRVAPDAVAGRVSLLAGRHWSVLVQLDPAFLPEDGDQLGKGAADLQLGLLQLADLALREESLEVVLVLGNSLHARHGLAVKGELLEEASE